MSGSRKKKKSHRFLFLVLICLLGIGAFFLVQQDIDPSRDFQEAAGAEQIIREYAEKKKIPFSAYPESLISLLERNPETKEFVLQYPFRKKSAPTLAEYQSAKDVPLFIQWDPQWGYEIYGSDVLGITGCGPASLAMVGYYLTGDERFTPDRIAAFSEANGYYVAGSGSSWTLISQGSEKLGLKAKELPLVQKIMERELEAGRPIICVVGPGDFTTDGHYLVLKGLEDGKFKINDPNSRINSQKLWSYEQLAGQIKNLWSVEKAS